MSNLRFESRAAEASNIAQIMAAKSTQWVIFLDWGNVPNYSAHCGQNAQNPIQAMSNSSIGWPDGTKLNRGVSDRMPLFPLPALFTATGEDRLEIDSNAPATSLQRYANLETPAKPKTANQILVGARPILDQQLTLECATVLKGCVIANDREHQWCQVPFRQEH